MVEENHLLPSQFLPLLRPVPTLAILLLYLHQLETLLSPENITINLVQEDESQAGAEEDALDEFEIDFVRGWLERSLNIALQKLEEVEEEEEEEWTRLLDRLTRLLSQLSGHGGESHSSFLPNFNSY